LKEIEKITVNNENQFFRIRNGLKQGEALSPLLFKFAVEYALGGSGKPGGLEIEWYISGAGIC
jgi:hypothetical protein